MKRFELTVRGSVQGVGFRAQAVRQAEALGITGTVQNNPDGSVAIVAEGPDQKLQAFLDWASAGPPAADVSHGEVSWRTPTGDFDSFKIIF